MFGRYRSTRVRRSSSTATSPTGIRTDFWLEEVLLTLMYTGSPALGPILCVLVLGIVLGDPAGG
ncbi:MAG: hypothetical protein M3N09_09830 [Actinomycetota bacterium]|nr:hypothetical protein [Actinomycetota bacterium]